MFIAHLPAGYLLTRHLLDRAPPAAPLRAPLMFAGLAGAVLPDLDLLYFYLIDHGRHLHHIYWPHLPVFWLLVFAAVLPASRALRHPAGDRVVPVLAAIVFLHLVLDSVTGGIAWLHPFSPRLVVLVAVPPGHEWWVWNFVLHWTFAVELALCGWAVAVYRASRRVALQPD